MTCNKCCYHEKDIYTTSGYCMYFKSIGKEKKEIPLDVVDKGCKFFKIKTEKHPLYDLAMEMFNGVEIK